MEFIEFPNGGQMPIIGYGTWQAAEDELETALEAALEAGYRHIDAAAAYMNEHVIGRVLKKWISDGRLKREDLFIVTKVPPPGVHQDRVEKYLKKSLEDLQLDYVDLYLVHTPFTLVDGKGLNPVADDGTILYDTTADLVAVWKVMEEQYDLGRTKAIGVSNFNKTQLDRITEVARIPVENIQIEIHLYLQQSDMITYCKSKNITVCAYSPLGSRGTSKIFDALGISKEIPDEMSNPEVLDIASKYGKTTAQILLRFLTQKGIAVIPKSINPERIKQNIEILDFSLNDDEISRLEALDQGEAARIVDFNFFNGIKNHPEFPF
uniref:NADP-dependent oxidoreductase domain-containing protein n=1 Tax=Clastoptera arizonana TaxID=38151 RepID=A0A1B6BZ52_9HEMI